MKVKGCTVAFTKDLSDELAEEIMKAIRQLRWVEEVTPREYASDDWLNRMNIRQEIRDEIKALFDKLFNQS